MATPSAAAAGLSRAEKPKRSYDSAFKLKVIDYTGNHSISDTARHFAIDRKRVREWKKQREELQALPPKRSGWKEEAERLPYQASRKKWSCGLMKCEQKTCKLLEHAFKKKRLASLALEERQISLPVGVGWKSFVGGISCHCAEEQQ